ncbi:MAG: sensor histidine kinase [Burkholderiaceae bacterium]
MSSIRAASDTRTTDSLKLTLTRRLVIGLLFIGLFGAIVAYVVGTRFANRAYDRSLFDDVRVLANQVRSVEGSAQITLSPDALLWLLADEGDDVIYRVTDLSNRRVLTSNGNLGGLPDLDINDDEPYFRSVALGDTRLRVAYVKRRVGPATALVEIAETTRKRTELSQGILIGTVSMMSLIILVAVALVWSGVSRALAPLAELEADAARRSIGNMQPLDPRSAPAEVRGLIEAINHMIARVAQAIDMQRHFLANAAHQLKTPIAGLRLQAQLALKAEASGPAHDSMREVERRATHSAHLIEQLLTLAHAESSDDSLPVSEIDLAQVAQQVIERRLPDAIARRIDLGFEGDGKVCVIVANEVLVGELLGNLVDNGLRYGHGGGHVTVVLERDEHGITLAVSDDGAGLPTEQREQVFRRYWRSDAASSEGAGLGLAIVKEIAERYRGTVAIVSRPEFDGTRVEVRFATDAAANIAVPKKGERTT